MSHSEKPDAATSLGELVEESTSGESSEEGVAASKPVADDEHPEEQEPVEEAEQEDAANQEEEIDQHPDIDELLNQVIKANEQLATFRDQALRAQAEMQNVRKRAQRDVENAHKYGLEKFLTNLLPVIDSLEKAIESATEAEDSNEAVVEGVELCLKMMLDILAKEHVEQVSPEGEPFDPAYHEAMSVVENPDMEPNSVVQVFQKGYTLNGRLIRPAMVIVSKTSN